MKQIILAIIVVLFMVVQVIYDDGSAENTQEDHGQKHIVTRVIDGDTFDIETGERIRMIGIDTPERGKYFYKEAKVRLENLIGDKEVILQKDVSETDRYGRLLRHVYYDDVWINKQMIDEGYAKIMTFPPDVAHVDIFTQAQKNARENGRGLWAD